MENLKYRKPTSPLGDDTYFLDGHRVETLQMRDDVIEATLKMFGRTHHVTTVVYHLGLDGDSQVGLGWKLPTKAFTKLTRITATGM